MNEWVPVKGCIYCGYGQMDPVGSIPLLLRPWMGYDYIVIQVVCVSNSTLGLSNGHSILTIYEN